MTYQTFRTEEGARLFRIQQMQAGFRTCIVFMGSLRWEVRSWN